MQVSYSMLLQNGDVIIAVEMYVSLVVLSTFPVIFVYAFYRKDVTDSCHYTMVMKSLLRLNCNNKPFVTEFSSALS